MANGELQQIGIYTISRLHSTNATYSLYLGRQPRGKNLSLFSFSTRHCSHLKPAKLFSPAPGNCAGSNTETSLRCRTQISSRTRKGAAAATSSGNMSKGKS